MTFGYYLLEDLTNTKTNTIIYYGTTKTPVYDVILDYINSCTEKSAIFTFSKYELLDIDSLNKPNLTTYKSIDTKNPTRIVRNKFDCAIFLDYFRMWDLNCDMRTCKMTNTRFITLVSKKYKNATVDEIHDNTTIIDFSTNKLINDYILAKERRNKLDNLLGT